MTPEQQRIAIAEAAPEAIKFIPELGVAGRWCYQWLGVWRDCVANDPLFDLNAMHEAEKTLNPSQRCDMAATLLSVLEIRDDQSPDPDDMFLYLHATAAQRCEALLKTLNLWQSTGRESP